MLIFRSIVCLFLLTYSYAQDLEPEAYHREVYFPVADLSNNMVIRAEDQNDNFKIDFVDRVSFVIDGEWHPFLKVEGRVCLNIEGDGWCDMIQYLFSLPSDDFHSEVKTIDKQQIVEVFLRKDNGLILVGASILKSKEFQTVELDKDIILFFDRSRNVPALIWLMPSQDSYFSRSRRARFNRLYEDLI